MTCPRPSLSGSNRRQPDVGSAGSRHTREPGCGQRHQGQGLRAGTVQLVEAYQ
ncbi:hypothetical protein [Deinococcus marmoris]|uniref:hypothetical protein n=1 Tax=Deinococcus marmoris TaxID=249408 RepID=UPI00158AF862|nr:hypothetical protein [Deinococcus marmoris]